MFVVLINFSCLLISSVRGLFTNNVARLLSWCWPQLQALSFGGQDIDGAGLLAVGKPYALFHTASRSS